MKRQVRRGVFETNSSSVHSLTMCMKSEYDKWIAGELLFDRYNDSLVDKNSAVKDSDYEYRYLTYEDFDDYDKMEYETFEEKMTTPNGEEIVSFGYYGMDN